MAILTTGTQFKTAHWYTREGAPAHTQPTASGDGDRTTTIRDAKKLGLLPSVTSILGILDKPQLTVWKIGQALQAADANPREPNESVEYWVKRVTDAAFQQVEEAAEMGTRIHAALDAAFAGQGIEPDLAAYIQPVMDWIQKTGIVIKERELRLLNLREGYAGPTDVIFTFGKQGRGVLDYKTKKTRVGEKVMAYLEHKVQLSAYAAAYWGEAKLDDVLCANVFISSTEPGRVEICKHTEVRRYYQLFLHLCEIWRTVKDYDPRQPVPEKS